jgi:hypothetical protein
LHAVAARRHVVAAPSRFSDRNMLGSPLRAADIRTPP